MNNFVNNIHNKFDHKLVVIEIHTQVYSEITKSAQFLKGMDYTKIAESIRNDILYYSNLLPLQTQLHITNSFQQ